ncbi:Flp pilus assembly protein CpaB [Tundrisphaera sp. TA3]|uniref:Flp pilus assembly protein CpaB n=1 Tax=Tundrisphaera sp. TA3 TaxID=3435775 RepID=UPI003EBDF575
MRGRTILVAILALACGLAAFVGISMMGTGTPAAVATRPVIFAIAEIRRGAPIEKEMIEIRRIPEAVLPPAALGKPEDVLGRIAAMKMIPGDAVTDGKLEPKGARARIVPRGKLAFTVARADMPPLEVDDHVDVYFAANGQAPAIPPLQDILVWDVPAADKKPGANAQGPVTLLVDPRQANDLNQGMNQGGLRLVRRNPDAPIEPAQTPTAPVAAAPAEDAPVECGMGMRQYALENTPPTVTIGGLLRAGDFVDVILTRKGKGDARSVSRTLQDIRVSWAKSGAGANPAQTPSVILCVTPDEAATLDRAASDGTVHLARRDPQDRARVPLQVEEAAANLRAYISPRMRAFTFDAINPSVTLGGRVRPQDRVDVITITKPAKADAMVARTVPNVEVLSITSSGDDYGEEKQSVTLLVTPEEVEVLALAQMTGTLYLSLRKPGDDEIPPEPAQDREVSFTTKTLRGTSIGADRLTYRVPADARKKAPVAAPVPAAPPLPRPDRSAGLMPSAPGP